MRYLFRGMIRDTGGPVEGHVEAATEEAGYETLSVNGVVTESLIPDPMPLNLNEELPASPEFADALESAFDSSSSQVDFDALSQRYHGKKVWVIDRDKIRRRVSQVVDAALALSQQHGEGSGKARERVANAIQGLFNDTSNLATQRNAESIAGIRFNAGGETPAPATGRFNGSPPPPRPPMNITGYAIPDATGHPGLEQQIARMANLVKQAEATLTAVAAAARRGGGDGGGGPRRRAFATPGRGKEQNEVLLEIFKSNLELVRGMQNPALVAATAADIDAAAAPAVEQAIPTVESTPEPQIEYPIESPVESSTIPAVEEAATMETGPTNAEPEPVPSHGMGEDEDYEPLPVAEVLPAHD